MRARPLSSRRRSWRSSRAGSRGVSGARPPAGRKGASPPRRAPSRRRHSRRPPNDARGPGQHRRGGPRRGSLPPALLPGADGGDRAADARKWATIVTEISSRSGGGLRRPRRGAARGSGPEVEARSRPSRRSRRRPAVRPRAARRTLWRRPRRPLPRSGAAGTRSRAISDPVTAVPKCSWATPACFVCERRPASRWHRWRTCR